MEYQDQLDGRHREVPRGAALHHALPVEQQGQEILERITLRGVGRGSTVTKVVTIRNHGMPWFFTPLVWFIANFGARVGPDPLKVLCESGG